MRLLLIAPTANRESTGEARIAYDWVSRLAERHDVTVLSYFQRAHEPLASQIANARVVEWAEPRLVGRYERINAMMNPGYVPFRRRARAWIRSATAHGERFDIGHQVAPISLRYPSPLTGTGVPYVVGPVGGSLQSPPGFSAEEGGAPGFTALRRLDRARLRYDPQLRRSFADASCVIGIADYVRDILKDVPLRSFETLGDTGVDHLPPRAAGSARTTAVRFLFLGRVIRTKGVRDAIRALALLGPGRGTLDIVGDGYDRTECESLAARLGVSSLVRFHGRVPHEAVCSHYSKADVFLFPSYREAGGIAVVEAMSYGLPVIVCDRGGPATTANDISGFRVPAISPEQYARALAGAMESLAGNPALRARMGGEARARIEKKYLWDRRIAWMESLYGRLLGR
ncbi:glycosyltransferase family 4 protein [Glutamicibacter protophormiae]|uniref:glycosyltransferase family 4 protein n=1 Tax=Glutamicibacter protophormiae TaxID=37930 RepID=UPI003A8FF90D